MESDIDTITVFGINPFTNEIEDIEARLKVLSSTLERFNPKIVICLGGETWTDESGNEISEAAFIARKAADIIGLRAKIVQLPYGYETITQTHALINYLRDNDISYNKLGVISSWQQLLRCGIVFLIDDWKLPTMLPVLANYTLKVHAYNLIICTLAGAGYTILSEILTRLNIWEEGGPLVRRIIEEREDHRDSSWFNTHNMH